MDKFYKIITFGCQMNVHDSEKLAGVLEQKGFKATGGDAQADIIVFNTCCIRHTAERKALGNILAYRQKKEKKPDLILAVVGCMSQQPEINKLLSETYPFIDIVLGTGSVRAFSDAVDAIINKGGNFHSRMTEEMPVIEEGYPLARSGGANAWLDITYGCDNFCSYCIVPYVRGRERSREASVILKEAESLISQGYKEITLLGQNVNSYFHNGVDFAGLLERVASLEGDFRIRFMTSHPKDFSQKVADIIASYDKICKYIHLPIQSGSNNILKKMNRKYTREHYLSLIDLIREKMPQAGISTDIMVGFPGEEEQDFVDTLDLVRQVRFSSAFTFKYSRRKGTAADKMDKQVPETVKTERIEQLIKLQNEITAEQSRLFVGKTVRVLVEDVSGREEDTVCGREDSGRLVNIKGAKDRIGQFCDVEITNAKSASLWGRIANG
ncbi:MAG: tRNA (N6-isopentenyl adenosine(37)-C2)-methylthiotransferase MiaB [Christensenellales bacterium]|jgi:tRNA-2-methylthio-N6-dimethylallyladenosine synthase